MHSPWSGSLDSCLNLNPKRYTTPVVTETAWSTCPKANPSYFVWSEPDLVQPSASEDSQKVFDGAQPDVQSVHPDRFDSNPGFERMLAELGVRHLHVWLDVLHVEPGP